MQVTTTTKPRFRSDLVAQPIDESGQRFVDVIDPDTGKAFRFFEVEYSIACAMDGDRDVSGLVAWARAELGVAPSEDELTTVITTLSDLGYLDGSAAGAPAAAKAATSGFDISDDSLVPGVVHAVRKPQMPSSGIDVELGASGAAEAREEALPDGSGVELGAAGSTGSVPSIPQPAVAEDSFADVMGSNNEFETPTPPPPETPMPTLKRSMRGVGADDDEGPTQLPAAATGFDDDEVSVDLSTHLSLDADDVKEAVRASREMAAVDVPADLLAELDGGPAAKAAEPAQLGTPAKGIAASLDAVAEAIDDDAGSVPIELPDSPKISRPLSAAKDKADAAKAKADAASETDKAEPRASGATHVAAPRSSAGLLVALLVIVALAAGAYYYYTNYMQEKPAAPKPPPVAEVKPPPPPPPAPSAVMAEAEAPRVEVAAGKTGVVVWIVDIDTEVEAGAIVAKLRGIEATENKIRALEADIERYKRDIARAEKALAAPNPTEAVKAKNQATIDKRNKDIEAKLAEIEAKNTEAEPFTIKAPTAGIVEASTNKNATLSEDTVVATLRGPDVITGVFTVPGDAAYVPGSSVEVSSKANPATRAACTAVAVEGAKVTVQCPAGGDISVGDQVVLK